MFRYPVKFDQYLQDLQKSIDYILKIIRKPKVDKIISGTYITVSPASGTGDVTVSVNTALLHSGGLYAQTAPATVVTGTAPQTLINGGVGTMTVPANGFQVGDSFVAYFAGKISCVNNAVLEIKIISDGDTLADTGLMTMFATTNKDWEMFVNFTVRSIGVAGVASMATSGRFLYNKDSAAQPESIGFFNLDNTTFDTTVSNTLNVTAQWDTGNPINQIQTEMFNLYRIY
jgi:hypothetical protein